MLPLQAGRKPEHATDFVECRYKTKILQEPARVYKFLVFFLCCADLVGLSSVSLQADNEVLIRLSVLNATVETFNEKKSNFLSSLWNILADSGLSDVKVELYAVMEGDDALRSASEIMWAHKEKN